MFVARDIGAGPGPGDDFWYAPVGATTAAGVRVNADTALRFSTVYKCVRIRSETVGMLPIMVYRRREDGGKDATKTSPLHALLHDQPNPWQTAMQWKQLMQSHLDLRGNAYSQVVYGGSGRVDMLVPLMPDRMKVEILPNGLPRYKYRDDKRGEITLVFGEVLHIAGLSCDGYVGMSPIEIEREAIAAGIAARDYGARHFTSAPRASAWIEVPGKQGTDTEKREWSRKFSEGFGGVNAGKIPVLDQGRKLHQLTLASADAQFIEHRKFTDIDIAAIFRMPPHKMGILDRATWANIEHQQLDFVTDTIMPSCVAWEQALLRDLPFSEDEFPEFKLSMLLRGDTKTRYEAYGKGIQDGWLVRNEARAMENLNPIDGLDAPLEPMNMAPAGSRGAAQARGEPAARISGERQALIVAAAAERVARKGQAILAKGDEAQVSKFAEFVAEVMRVPPEAARGFVADMRADADVTAPGWIDRQAAALVRLGD